MSFEHDDETAFHARCDELIEQFAAWLGTTDLPGADAGDARILLDWKWSHEDGRLGTWTTEHLERFLLGWCPRKLSMPAAECEGFPVSIGGFCLFLGAGGLLAPGSDPPPQLWSWCERHVRRFVAEMANPANYDMAKGIFARVGGLEPGQDLSPDGLAELMERAQALPREALGEVVEGSGEPADPLTVGPVRLPGPAQRAESAAAAPALRQLQQLSEFCSPPGRSLTQKGNLRLVDARHLVEVLATGDTTDVRVGRHRRSLRSAEDLPMLSWLVQLALDAKILRRHCGRLVTVARHSDLPAVEAVDGLVDAAVERGMSGELSPHFPGLAPVHEFVDAGVGRLLAELLGAEVSGTAFGTDDLIKAHTGLVGQAFPTLHGFHLGIVQDWVAMQLDRLAALGLIALHDQQLVTTEWGSTHAHGGTVTLTAAGMPVAARLAEQIGITVLSRPDPADATAEDIVDLVGVLHPDEWLADATSWAHSRDTREAARELAGVLNDAQLPAPVVFATIGHLEAVVDEHATSVVQAMLGGPHDGLALYWLDTHGVAATGVPPDRVRGGIIDVLGVMLDLGGADDVIEWMTGPVANARGQIELLDQLWRTDHPRLAELLDVIGQHHPDKTVAKAARKSLMRHRSWLAAQR